MPYSDGKDGLSMVARRPALSVEDATDWLRRDWGIVADLRPLGSERDQNWMASVGGTPRVVLKIANADEDPEVLSLQHLLLERAGEAGLPCPELVRTTTGWPTATRHGHLGWVITALPGDDLADVPDPGPGVWHELGELLGGLAHVLADVDHPAAHRRLQWDVVHAEEVLTTYRGAITDPERGRLVDEVLRRFREVVAPVLHELPRSLVHNDANDHNVLVHDGALSGLIDFGDAVNTITVNDLAIACAYAMLGRAEPAAVAAAITEGYVAERTLSSAERAVLPTLVLTRLATSVSVSAHQQTLAPDDPYLRISEQPAWDLLATLMGESGHVHR